MGKAQSHVHPYTVYMICTCIILQASGIFGIAAGDEVCPQRCAWYLLGPALAAKQDRPDL